MRWTRLPESVLTLPNRKEHQVRYHGRYAGASRCKRRQEETSAGHRPGSQEPPAEEESAAERFSCRRRRSLISPFS